MHSQHVQGSEKGRRRGLHGSWTCFASVMFVSKVLKHQIEATSTGTALYCTNRYATANTTSTTLERLEKTNVYPRFTRPLDGA
eukprot:scaffold18816_cov32-Tisochrysis_lutea.AAC.3